MAKTRRKSSTEAAPEMARENAGAPQASGDTTAAAPDRDRIAMRAYELYLARGGQGGQDLSDWLEAERELAGTGPDRRMTGE